MIKVIRPENISTVWINLFDFKVEYDFTTNDYGSFTTGLDLSYFDTYEYEDLFGGIQNALGNQNANSGVVPPLPQIKAIWRTNWFMANHSASMIVNYTDEVKFDDNSNALFTGFTAPNTIDAQTIVNAQYGYVFDDLFGSELVVSGGIRNLFDEMPQRLPILGGFESRLQQPWGRQLWVSLDWTPNL